MNCINCNRPFDEHAAVGGDRVCPGSRSTFNVVFEANPEVVDFVKANLDKSPEELTRMWIDRVVTRDRERAKAKYPPSCRRCNDRGVIETGNNDLPCDCPAGDTALFNTERGTETGAEIKARRR